MTRLFDKRLGALVRTLVTALVMTSLGATTGCKKTPKKDGATGSETAPVKTMDAKETRGVTKDGKKKAMAGKPGVAGGGLAGMVAPPASPAPPPVSGQPRPAAGPVKVQLVVGLNAAKLRKTFLWSQLMSIGFVKTILAGKTYGELKKALGKDPIQIVDSARVVLGGRSLNDIKKPKHLALMVSGRFDASATLRKLMKIPVKAGIFKPLLSKVNGKDAIRGKGKEGEGFALVAMNKNTIAICSDSMVDIVTKGDLTGGNAAIAAQLKPMDAKSLAWIVFGGVNLPAGGTSAVPVLAALSKIQGGSVVLDNNKTKWKMVNRLDVGTPQAAESLLQLANMMKMALDKPGVRPGAPPAALGAILKKMTATAKGRILIATLELSEADVKTILDSLLKKL